VERKRLLRALIPEQPSVLLFADHIERDGIGFFRLTCERDLEGVVAKLKRWRYGEGWFKIRNPGLFAARWEARVVREAARRDRSPASILSWHMHL
jgi:ATP-dependent DNA ligase